MLRTAALFALALSAPIGGGASGKGDDPFGDLVRWLNGRSAAGNQKLVAQVKAAIAEIDDPWLKSVHAAAARAHSGGRKTAFTPKTKASPDGSFPLAAEIPFPLHVEYIFGAGIVRPFERTAPATTSHVVPGSPADELRALLEGEAPDGDLALAATLRDLDADHSADEFATFLETWRNGDESFYRALDRTAGTPGEVFYYDVMLFEFAGRFMGADASKLMAKKKSKGLQDAHDALHNGFLAYRQYRGLREAAALSVLLRRESALPKNLARYEQAPAGQSSMRDEIGAILAANDGDITKVTALLTSTAKPLPQPLWSAHYEALAPFNQAFLDMIPKLLQKAGHTDQLVARWKEMRAESAKKIAETTRKVLAAAGCTAFAGK